MNLLEIKESLKERIESHKNKDKIVDYDVSFTEPMIIKKDIKDIPYPRYILRITAAGRGSQSVNIDADDNGEVSEERLNEVLLSIDYAMDKL